jgi:hypothetical protein
MLALHPHIFQCLQSALAHGAASSAIKIEIMTWLNLLGKSQVGHEIVPILIAMGNFFIPSYLQLQLVIAILM